MIIRTRMKRGLGVDEPLKHESHKRPVTRRDFLAQGMVAGGASVIAPSVLGMLSSPAMAALSQDIDALRSGLCNIQLGAGKVPFVCFDLAGGASFMGSNVLTGGAGGQLDFISTAGYQRQGVPPPMLPSNPAFVNTELGLAFHQDSGFLRGILEKTTPQTREKINGVVIPARSENDTGNNPHNPMYGIAKTGARGALLSLIGSQASDSGGNSMAPAMMIDPEIRPTKVDRPSDATGLVATGGLGTMFSTQGETVSVMESMSRATEFKLARTDTLLGADEAEAKRLAQCSYVRTAYQTNTFGNANVVNPLDPSDSLVGAGFPTTVFSSAEMNDNEFRKTASVAKLVVEGFAGAGTVSMGGYDYHDGTRASGELRDLRAGRCIGAVLEYAARKNQPVMIYVFSDGSLSANTTIDTTQNGRDKYCWQGDNQGLGCAFLLVYNPAGRPALASPAHQQLGFVQSSGDVNTAGSPAANSVLNLVDLVILNYLALHGQEGDMTTLYPNSVFASPAMISRYAAFASLSSVVPPPPPPGGVTSCTSGGAAITANHGHSLFVPIADLSSTTNRTYPIQGTGTHNHIVTLTPAQLQSLATGPVTVTSTTDGAPAHSHVVTVTCV